MPNMKDKIRSRLAKISLDDGDFEALVDLVEQDMDTATGGFQLFSSFQQYVPGPGPGPGGPTPPQVPSG